MNPRNLDRLTVEQLIELIRARSQFSPEKIDHLISVLKEGYKSQTKTRNEWAIELGSHVEGGVKKATQLLLEGSRRRSRSKER